MVHKEGDRPAKLCEMQQNMHRLVQLIRATMLDDETISNSRGQSAHRIKPYLGLGVPVGSAYFRPAESTV